MFNILSKAGALAIEHAEENPDSEFAVIIRRLLNQNVRVYRRRLFAEGVLAIEPEPPKGSKAWKAWQEQKRKDAARRGEIEPANDDGTLKSEFNR